MAKRSSRKKGGGLDIGASLRPEIWGILLLLMGLLTLLSLVPVERGALMEGWIALLQSAVGWGVWLVPIGFGGVGLWLIFLGLGRQPEIEREKPWGALLLFLLGLALVHLIAAGNEPRSLAAEGEGGGYLGYWLSQLLISGLGTPAAVLVLVTLSIVSLMMLLGMSLGEMWAILSGSIRRLSRPEGLPGVRINRGGRRAPAQAALPEPTEGAAEAAAAASAEEAGGFTPPRPQGSIFPRIIGGEQVWRLPPIDDILVEASEQELSQAEIRDRVKIIEETLSSFGVPAKVIEVNQGPTVTQFGVEPGYIERRDSNGRIKRNKIKVSKIANLANDLALALAASPIRIEAPVPGRSIVGIEVPNSEIALVALRTVLESDLYAQIKGALPIALGQDVAGTPIATDLAAMPHLLIAGATGSGKSVCVNSIIASLLCSRTPDEVQFIMIDPKMVELTAYNGIPHLRAPVVIELERVVGVLNWATREMDQRYKMFNRARARNVEAYNEMLVNKGEKPLPYMVVIIDELADLMMVSADEVERSICRIAQMARATGIHLVIATQRPSVDVVTGLIKANFPARISFAVTSQVDSRVIIDTAGADKLLGRGDMLFMAPDSSKLQRLQGCFVSDKELANLVRYWKGVRAAQEPVQPQAVVQKKMWEEIQAAEEQAAQQDELLPKAIALVRDHERASISMLQRRLRIGYSRAARLIETMERQGIVGPPPGGSATREVLDMGNDDRGDELPPL
ncbi:MAG: DNA translocase FtsK [Anaerolineae bacterium]|jgi:S-DNA-T family DNA segregation ATPase FtsK/SpoIIIE